MITLSNVSKSYGSLCALNDINLTVTSGEIFGVIGQSGAGKSTLIRCVNLLERPDSGEIIVDGQNLLKLNAQQLRMLRHKIGMIFQHFNLLNNRTVAENIALPLELLHFSKKDIQARLKPLIELTGLENKLKNYPTQLSGGQKQRVAIARALACSPSVLLCDEATSALDPHTTENILKLLKKINTEMGITILLITHEMEVVKKICDRVALLDQGKIIETDTIGQFFAHPKTAVAKKLISTLLKKDLPEFLTTHLQAVQHPGAHQVWRLIFSGHSAKEALITALIQKYQLEVNILQASIETLKNETLGIMLMTVNGSDDAITKGHQFLIDKKIEVEVLGYVLPEHAH